MIHKLSKRGVKIVFIGAGSIGSLFGGYLASLKSEVYSTEVVFFCSKSHADTIEKNGLLLRKGQKSLEISDIKAFPNLEDAEKVMQKDSDLTFDFVFLTTKTYDSETALNEYQKIIQRSNWLVILQNGIGNEELVSKYCSESKIIRIVTTNGAFLDKPGQVIHTGIGLTKLGFPFRKSLSYEEGSLKSAESELSLLSDLLNSVGLESVVVEEIIKECWEKIFVNVGINAFGALTRLNNGELIKHDGLKRLMGVAINEALQVAELKNINLSKKDYIALTYDVAEKTSENKNSMLQDILMGKNTEIDFINGRIVKFADELGVRTPINELLTQLIMGLEQSLN